SHPPRPDPPPPSPHALPRHDALPIFDPTRRATSPEAVDEHLVDEDRREGLLLGDRPVPLSPEADHAVEDEDAQLYGTTDMQHAKIGRAHVYSSHQIISYAVFCLKKKK